MNDPKMIAIFGGFHSPPLITNNTFINQNKILTLVPWAAGGPITRSKISENWIYRLSIDDAQAGGFISKYAATKEGCTRPFLVLENTPWGKSNERNMKKGLAKLKLAAKQVQYFGWGVSKSSALKISERISKSNSDCIFFVGNGKDATVIFDSFGKSKIDLPIFSHWGITGGNSRKMAQTILNNKLNVSIIQTKFTFLSNKYNKFQMKIKNQILKNYDLKNVEDIQPMSGWVHGFDLTRIFLNAFSKVSKKGAVSEIRKRLKNELENMSTPTEGLIKNSHFSELYPHRILLVEDNLINQKLGKLMLQKLGYECTICENGQEALDNIAKLGHDYYSIIFMDMQMPVMDGVEATEKFFEIYPGTKTPIIAMTANAFAEDKEACFNAGMSDFISKSIDLNEIRRVLSTFN